MTAFTAEHRKLIEYNLEGCHEPEDEAIRALLAEHYSGYGTDSEIEWRQIAVQVIAERDALEADNVRLAERVKVLEDAITQLDRCNSHHGSGPHCTCSQLAREIIARAALSAPTKS